MLKRLERDATKADLAAVEALLKARTAEEDPVGYMQFSRRYEHLTRRLEEIGSKIATTAEVGLFFGGRPVIGSYGIQAEFGAKAVGEFQTLVSSAFAATEGPLGARGPVPQRDRTQLMLTDIARGSFGFILQQPDNAQLFDTELKEALSNAVDLIFRVASPDQETFESITEEIDSRVLGALRSFFKMLDEAGATLRIVEDRREFTLRREEIGRARERTEDVTFHENESEAAGTIYILPVSRRFELHPTGSGEVLRGVVTRDCLLQLTGGGTEVTPGLIGSTRSVRLRVREIRSRGHEPKKSYTVLAILDAQTSSITVQS